MFGRSKKKKNDMINDVASKLVEISKTDTVYRDIYLNRARKIISDILPPEEYRRFAGERRWLSRLPNKISAAMEQGDWNAVKELSETMVTMTEQEEKMRHLLKIGDEVYKTDEVGFDPFSPGFDHLAGIPYGNLSPLRDRIVKHLEELQKEDPSYKAFYSGRYDRFQALSLIKPQKRGQQPAELDEAGLRELARQVLSHGDMKQLEEIAELMLKKETSPGAGAGEWPGETVHHDWALASTFSEKTLAGADRLGLAAVHLDESKEYRSLFRYALHPVMDKDPERAWEAMTQKETGFPSETPGILRDHIRLYAIHIFLTSGGSRYLPDFVAEDGLVEVFPEPLKADDDQGSELLSLLGFEHRRGLSRKQIEHSLLQNGPRILEEELGLEPELFRLVCIPPDIHFRLGPSRGWGEQEIWTHFDGYQTDQKGNLKALAGGDVRYGGIYDLVSIGREYVSDHVIARFAAIQRRRMSTW